MAKKKEEPIVNIRLRLPKHVHRRLKIQAAVVGKTIPETVIELLDRHLPKLRK